MFNFVFEEKVLFSAFGRQVFFWSVGEYRMSEARFFIPPPPEHSGAYTCLIARNGENGGMPVRGIREKI